MIRIIHRLEWFVGLALLQALVLNQMHVNGYAMSFLYIYFILKFQTKIGRNELMLWSFAIGLTVDMFSNTCGMNAAAATCLAFCRMTFLKLVTLRDMDESFRPGIKTLGFGPFVRYVLLSSSLFCTLLLLIDAFSFFNIFVLLFKIISSIVATMLCIICAELIGGRRSEKRL